VQLRPGQAQDVTLTLAPGDLATWDTTSHSWIVTGGTYRLYVGDGSDVANLPLTTTIPVAATTLGVDSGPSA
jgi:beta-glucosidase